MLLEDCLKSRQAVAVEEPHFTVFQEFQGTSYAQRYELLLRKLVQERLYDSAAFITATEEGGSRGIYREPASDLTMRRLLASLAGHVSAMMASLG